MIIRIWLNIPFTNLAIKTLSTYLEFPIDTSVCEIHVAQSFICRNATIRSILKKKIEKLDIVTSLTSFGAIGSTYCALHQCINVFYMDIDTV